MSYDEIKIETISLQEVTLLLRSLGMKVSEMTIGSGIDQGKYPFAICIHTDKDGRRFEIYKRLLDEWISDRAVPRKNNAYSSI